MSKAEERALEAYPVLFSERRGYDNTFKDRRESYIKSYHQAEKDLELTWEDIKVICDIAFEEACRLQRNMKSSHIYKEQHYKEVLKQFKVQKGE